MSPTACSHGNLVWCRPCDLERINQRATPRRPRFRGFAAVPAARTTATTIAAQGGLCAICGGHFRAGAEIRRRPDFGWEHEDCPE